jgi:hypothetical protein
MTVCAGSAESLTLMFLILFAMSFVGMMIVMLRTAMYPYGEISGFSNEPDSNGYDKDSSAIRTGSCDDSAESFSQSTTSEALKKLSSGPREPSCRNRRAQKEMVGDEEAPRV